MVSYLTVLRVQELSTVSLNPYCSGQLSRTILVFHLGLIVVSVLILIVVDNGLVLDLIRHY